MAKASHQKLLPKLIWLLLFLALSILVYVTTYYLAQKQSSDQPWGLIKSVFPETVKREIVSQSAPAAVDVESNQTTSASEISVQAGQPNDLLFGSFYEDFIGLANIDTNKTTLYRDHKAIAMFFPPDYSWTVADSKLVGDNKLEPLAYLNDWAGSTYDDQHCLGQNCLEVRNLGLYYNNKLLARPSDLSNQEVVAVSIGSVGQQWLVGFTIKKNNKYQGRVFSWSGTKFTKLNLPEFSSDYSGLFGFGGVPEDFLVVYGAYGGQGYRVRGNRINDISNFFQIKVMTRGFQPEVIRVANGSEVTWYVYSSTLSRPWLIKLWQNGTPEISGEAVFDNLFTPSTDSALFSLLSVSSQGNSFLVKLKENGQDAWKIFTDRGFKNEEPRVLISKLIAGEGVTDILIKNIAQATLGIDVASQSLAKLWFSGTGQDWLLVSGDVNRNWTVPATKGFFLKVTFPRQSNKFYSPFLTSVSFDYNFLVASTSEVVSSQPTKIEVNPSQNSNVLNLPTTENSVLNSPSANDPGVDTASAAPKPLIPADAIKLEVSATGFNPSQFTIKAGEAATIAFSSTDNSPHIFLFPQANLINLTTMVLGRETKLINFTAPAAGVYNFRDDIPNNRNNTGQMIVQ
jgi:plastocyanin